MIYKGYEVSYPGLPENKIMSTIKYLDVHFVLSSRHNFRKMFVAGRHMKFWCHLNQISLINLIAFYLFMVYVMTRVVAQNI
jgi:hypothetical protein